MLATRFFPAPTRAPQLPASTAAGGALNDDRIFPGWGPKI